MRNKAIRRKIILTGDGILQRRQDAITQTSVQKTSISYKPNEIQPITLFSKRKNILCKRLQYQGKRVYNTNSGVINDAYLMIHNWVYTIDRENFSQDAS